AASLLASAALVLVVQRPDAGTSDALVLMDGDVESERWRRIDAAFARIEVPPEVEAFDLWVEPAEAPVLWRVSLPGSSRETAARPSAASPRARLFLVSSVPGGQVLLSRERNRDAALERVWLREEGTWTCRGAWPL